MYVNIYCLVTCFHSASQLPQRSLGFFVIKAPQPAQDVMISETRGTLGVHGMEPAQYARPIRFDVELPCGVYIMRNARACL